MSENHNNCDKPTFINANRRGFLQSAAVAGGVAASGVAVASELSEEPVSPDPVSSNGKGYEVTDHVKKYYERARF